MCQQGTRNLKAATPDNQPIQQFPTMNTPLFSVLIANYNNGRYLMDAIESVRCQTYTHWEIVIVDDGSTDNSKTVYEGLKNDSRIRIFHNDENKGCGYTKRRCAELAKGAICGFLDPDDTLATNAIEKMVNAHLSNEKAALIYSRHNINDANMNFIKVSTQQHPMPPNGSFIKGDGGVSAFATFKKKKYDLTTGINPEYKRAIDHDLYYKLEETGSLVFIDEVLYNYRTNTGSNISVGGNETRAFMWHLIAMVDACRRRNLDIDETVCADFETFTNWNRVEAKDEGARMAKMTKSYRLGHLILKPVISLKKMMEHRDQ